MKHRFVEENGGVATWYSGIVKDYSQQDKTHSLLYDDESVVCHFDITIDLVLGDFIVL